MRRHKAAGLRASCGPSAPPQLSLLAHLHATLQTAAAAARTLLHMAQAFEAHLYTCSHECRGRGPCRKGSGGLHVYNYYENMKKNKKCGEELTFKNRGNRNLVIKADKDYRMRVIVKLNNPGACLLLCGLPTTIRGARRCIVGRCMVRRARVHCSLAWHIYCVGVRGGAQCASWC